MAYVPLAEAGSPYVGAGGRMRIGISNATIGLSQVVTLYTQPIVAPSPIAAPNDWSFGLDGSLSGAVLSPSQYINDGGVWAGTNPGIIEECAALFAHLKTGYGANWTISLLRLALWDPTKKVWRRAAPFPTVPSVAGTFGTEPASATDPLLGNVTTIIMPTYQAVNDGNTKVGRLVLKLPAWELNGLAKRVDGITGSSSPSGIVTANLTGLIGYLGGAATRIVGHNGGPADDIASVGVQPSVRHMRHIGLLSAA